MERIDKIEEKEKELETRLTELEKTGRELKEKLDELERQIKEFTSSRKRVVKRYKPLEFIKTETDNEISGYKNKTPAAGDEFRRDLLKKQIRDLIQNPKRYEESKDGVQTVSDDERRKILKSQITELIERFETRKDSKTEDEIKRPVSELKIKTGREIWDARPLFELLMDVGAVKSDDAAKRLGVNKNKINEWSEDMEKSGLVEITRYPYGVFEMRLKDIAVLLERKNRT